MHIRPRRSANRLRAPLLVIRMQHYTRTRQLDELQKMGSGRLLSNLQIVILLLVSGALIAGFLHSHAWFIVAGFGAIVLVAARGSAPHIRNAARAIRDGRSVAGTFELTVDTSGDSDTWQAHAVASDQRAWKFEFIPLYWKPAAGTFAGELVFIDGIAWPVLCFVGENVMHPRYVPTSA